MFKGRNLEDKDSYNLDPAIYYQTDTVFSSIKYQSLGIAWGLNNVPWARSPVHNVYSIDGSNLSLSQMIVSINNKSHPLKRSIVTITRLVVYSSSKKGYFVPPSSLNFYFWHTIVTDTYICCKLNCITYYNCVLKTIARINPSLMLTTIRLCTCSFTAIIYILWWIIYILLDSLDVLLSWINLSLYSYQLACYWYIIHVFSGLNEDA